MVDAPQIRLRPAVLRGRQRDLSHEARPVPAIESVTVMIWDAHSRGQVMRQVAVSLPRLRCMEKPQ